MTSQLVLIALLDGIAYAALVFIVSVGLTLIFGVLRVLNIAHGSLYAVGAYTAASFGIWIAAAKISPWLSYPTLAIAAAVSALAPHALRQVGRNGVGAGRRAMLRLISMRCFSIVVEMAQM